MATIDDLKAAVAAEASANAAAITLIQGMAQQIKDAAASNDTAALNDLANQLTAHADALAKAVTDNTPSQPTAMQSG